MIDPNKPPHDEPQNDSAYHSFEEPFNLSQFANSLVSIPNSAIASTEAGPSSRMERNLPQNISVSHNQAVEDIIEGTVLLLIDIPNFRDHQALNNPDGNNIDLSLLADNPPQSAFSILLNAPLSSVDVSSAPTPALEEFMAELGQPSHVEPSQTP